jgi:hypothetical protein
MTEKCTLHLTRQYYTGQVIASSFITSRAYQVVTNLLSHYQYFGAGVGSIENSVIQS